MFDLGGHGGKSDQATKLMQQLSGKEGSAPEGVFMIGTANEIPETRDDSERALFRKGRLEAYHFSTPSQSQREELVDHYVEEKYDNHEVDGEAISKMFSNGTTPAEIEALINQAYTNSVMRNMGEDHEPRLTTQDLAEELVREKTKQKQEIDQTESDRKSTAVHEAGHYHVAKESGFGTPIVSIEPQIRSLGKTHLVDPEAVTDFDRILDYAATAAAGYVAEKRNGFDPMSGIASDMERLDDIAERASDVMELDSIYHKYIQEDDDVPLEALVGKKEFEKMSAQMESDSQLEEIINSFEIINSVDRGKLGGGKTAVRASAMKKADDILEEAEQSGDFEETVNTLMEEGTVLDGDLP